MANNKKTGKAIRKKRCVSLSDDEVKEIKSVSGINGLTGAIRNLVKRLKGNK